MWYSNINLDTVARSCIAITVVGNIEERTSAVNLSLSQGAATDNMDN